MFNDALQNRIHLGDREAFLTVYEKYGHETYARLRAALRAEQLAKSAVKQTFLSLFEEILDATEDIDIPGTVRRLSEHESAILMLAHGIETDVPPETGASKTDSARVVFSSGEWSAADLPPLVRAGSFRRPEQALFIKKLATARRQRGAAGKILLAAVVFVLLWALAGALMKRGYLPALDLGYIWFDRTIWPLFTPGA